MKITSLTLENFRNHQKLQLNWQENLPITCLIGQNAQGKTNILEALYTLALSKSFRTNKQEDLIGWGNDYGRVQGTIQTEASEERQLEIFLGHPPQPKKSLKKNGVKISAEKFIGNFQVVLFHPEDLNMLYLGPDLRRKFLDMLNLQISRSYYASLSDYKKVLQQRNALLKAIKMGSATTAELPIWNEQIALHGIALMLERAKTVSFFQEHASEYYQKIAQKEDIVGVEYKHMFTEESDAEPSNNMSVGGSYELPNEPNSLQKLYLQALEKNLSKDLAAQYTTVGPHRDDLIFTLNARPLQTHASRGEYRSLLLALKLLEMRCIEEKTSEKPVLLLDDVFSELDFSRQEMLLKAIQEHQTIITATHIDNLQLLENGKIINVGELRMVK